MQFGKFEVKTRSIGSKLWTHIHSFESAGHAWNDFNVMCDLGDRECALFEDGECLSDYFPC